MQEGEIRRPGSERAAVAGLLLLCFLSSLGSLRSDLLPNLISVPLPPWEGQTIPFGLLALAAAALAVLRGAAWPRRMTLLSSVLVGVGLFVAPSVVSAVCAPWVSSMMRVVVFSLAPVFAVVFEPYLGRDTGSENRDGLAAALAAVAGVLCVFPVEMPHSAASGIALCALILAAACVAAANCRAVRIAAQLRTTSMAPMVAIAASTATVGMAAASALREQPVFKPEAIVPALAWSAGVELPALLMLFWLMRRMSAACMTTRFVLAPLIAILVSAALLRPHVDLRSWVGILLMAGGAGWLVLAAGNERAGDSSLLGLRR